MMGLTQIYDRRFRIRCGNQLQRKEFAQEDLLDVVGNATLVTLN
ncbi:MAG: hypothetical protein K0R08_226 [Solimicrobium sp.]|jgi:hypothetical protein|nr:hypothetical protein [Solimicrobium sp.]